MISTKSKKKTLEIKNFQNFSRETLKTISFGPLLLYLEKSVLTGSSALLYPKNSCWKCPFFIEKGDGRETGPVRSNSGRQGLQRDYTQ